MSPLAAELERRAVSQGELSRLSGLTRQTIFEAYHGRPCSLGTWVRIAKALKVPLRLIAPAAADELRDLVVA